MSQIIALLTDFGTTDAYVGIMKAVMVRIAPNVQFIDITHQIQPQNVNQAAFALLNSYRYFPPDTIFLCVVDPGVGGTRHPVAVNAGGYTFVAPDNGLLTHTLTEINQFNVVTLTNSAYQLSPVSNTFHGRDIFAPAAAHLANGIPLETFGDTIKELHQLPLPVLEIEPLQITGQVIYIDHFGNIITSIGELSWSNRDQLILKPRFGDISQSLTIYPSQIIIQIKNLTIPGIQRTYGETPQNHPLALISSGGFLEIAVNQGSAASRYNITAGVPVTLKIG
ncbi:MAG: SAM-dependent chlorinase/fluorinase [Anaerolineae bacterium]|nr:SAM-dependent chlorinase/fluorinase [Anaerolineae bacterium]